MQTPQRLSTVQSMLIGSSGIAHLKIHLMSALYGFHRCAAGEERGMAIASRSADRGTLTGWTHDRGAAQRTSRPRERTKRRLDAGPEAVGKASLSRDRRRPGGRHPDRAPSPGNAPADATRSGRHAGPELHDGVPQLCRGAEARAGGGTRRAGDLRDRAGASGSSGAGAGTDPAGTGRLHHEPSPGAGRPGAAGAHAGLLRGARGRSHQPAALPGLRRNGCRQGGGVVMASAPRHRGVAGAAADLPGRP